MTLACCVSAAEALEAEQEVSGKMRKSAGQLQRSINELQAANAILEQRLATTQDDEVNVKEVKAQLEAQLAAQALQVDGLSSANQDLLQEAAARQQRVQELEKLQAKLEEDLSSKRKENEVGPGEWCKLWLTES